jgi:hypothetical protein
LSCDARSETTISFEFCDACVVLGATAVLCFTLALFFFEAKAKIE